jgi:hypothetical protein
MMRVVNKLVYIIIISFSIVFLYPGCDDFLEKPDSIDVTEDTIFSTRLKAESFLWQTYLEIIPSGFPLPAGGSSTFQMPRSISANLCDESKCSTGWAPSTEINASGWSPVTADQNRMEDMWAQNWKGIRMAYTFIERVSDVPDIPLEEKEQMIAECKTLIALRYSRMFIRYGGLPILRKKLMPDDDFNIPRSTVEETVNFIVELCDEAIESNLPDVYPTKWRGRITKGVAYAIKSEVLLFAASPLFNTGTPYIEFDSPLLVCYGNYDVNRWKNAENAAKDLIEWAQTKGGVYLINNGNPFDDYGIAISKEDNAEIILAYKGNRGENGFFQWYFPRIKSGGWQENHSMLYNFLPNYYKEDGTDQVWDEKLGENYSFSEYKRKMDELEPRFKQTAWTFGDYPYNNLGHPSFIWDYNGVNLGTNGVCRVIKFLYQYQGETYKDWIVYRLAEFYLNLAEAINEYNPNDQTAYDALNVIRSRAGLPIIDKNDTRYNTQQSLRELIRRERAIELYAEDHRPNDLRRWKLKLGDNYWGGPVYGFQFTKNSSNNAYTHYNLYKIEDRYWNDKMYLYCFPQSEINKGIIKQNPGY